MQEGIESQAIDRCNRWVPKDSRQFTCVLNYGHRYSIGQKKPVHVYQLIAEKTVESKVNQIPSPSILILMQYKGHRDPREEETTNPTSMDSF